MSLLTGGVFMASLLGIFKDTAHRLLPDYAYWLLRYYVVQSAASWIRRRSPEVYSSTAGAEPEFVRRVRDVSVNRPTTLCRMMTKHGSDKGNGVHNYTTIYSALFAPMRASSLRVFELGLGTNNLAVESNMGAGGRPGASLRGWREFFPGASVYGADIDRSVLYSEERIATFFCDQVNPKAVSALWASPELKGGFDILIEDGLHTFEANTAFLEGSLHMLLPGGYYIVEDVADDEIASWQDLVSRRYREAFPDCDFCVVALPSPHMTRDNNLIVAHRVGGVDNPSVMAGRVGGSAGGVRGERPPGYVVLQSIVDSIVRAAVALPLLCSLLAGSLGALSCGGSAEPPEGTGGNGAPPCPSCDIWQRLRVGAGGFVTGIDIAPDGTKVVRTDQYGAYLWNTSTSQWDQLVTTSSMPSADRSVEASASPNIYEIRIAPGNTSRFYMMFGGKSVAGGTHVYRSDTRGASWTRTAFVGVTADPNDGYRYFGQKMAVDPANADVVYVGTPQNGLWVTSDAGATWNAVGDVPVSQPVNGIHPGITGIQFDARSGTTGGKTNTAYASSYGNGVYQTNTAGASWAPLAGAPATVRNAAMSSDSRYYVCTGAIGATSMYRYDGSWTSIGNPSLNDAGISAIMVDPNDNTRIVVARDGGWLFQSHNRGASWDGIVYTVSRVATDIPWLAWTDDNFMATGQMVFDPSVPNKIWHTEGIGVWTTTFPVTTPGSVTWTSQSRGIEQLVANAIAAPPGGKPVLASWDRPLFYVDNPDVFPSKHGPTNQFSMGWAVDYASTNPSFLAAIVGDARGLTTPDPQSSYSTDGGRNWTRFPTMPLNSTSSWNTFGFGTLAVSTDQNIVWVPSNKRAPYYTVDRGLHWLKVSLPGVADNDTPDGWGGLHWAYYLNRHIVAADRVNAGTFYMYHTSKGLFRSTDGGSTWALRRGPPEIAPGSNFNARLRTVPGKAGHLFFTSGPLDGGPADYPFMRSTDGGGTWTAVANVFEVFAFGFGKEAPGASYPTIYLVGWVNNVYGIWRSDTEAQTWTQIGEFPLGSLDQIKAVEGDPNVYGAVYVGFAGSGYLHYGPPS